MIAAVQYAERKLDDSPSPLATKAMHAQESMVEGARAYRKYWRKVYNHYTRLLDERLREHLGDMAVGS